MSNALISKIERYLNNKSVTDKLGQEVTSEEIVVCLSNTKSSFDLKISLDELWEEEKDYFKNNGMSAFDSGYLGYNEDGTKKFRNV